MSWNEVTKNTEGPNEQWPETLPDYGQCLKKIPEEVANKMLWLHTLRSWGKINPLFEAALRREIEISPPTVGAIENYINETFNEEVETWFQQIIKHASETIQEKWRFNSIVEVATNFAFKILRKLTNSAIVPYKESPQYNMRKVEWLKNLVFIDENLTDLLTLKDWLQQKQNQSTWYKKLAYTKYISDICLRIYDLQQEWNEKAADEQNIHAQENETRPEQSKGDREYERIKSQLQPWDIVLLNYDTNATQQMWPVSVQWVQSIAWCRISKGQDLYMYEWSGKKKMEIVDDIIVR